MEVLFEKWNPSTPACVFQHYFYNTVGEDRAPFYSPGAGEDEKKWEDALKKKPSAGAVPVLAVGPHAVGQRLEIQAVWARALQTRLHELNEILTKILQAHDLQYSVRSQEARRKHAVLSRRCLALATKVQVLRNRGYALDGVEEQLRTKLSELEKTAFDPMLSGRQEEIWAKMNVLRDRAQLLKNETDRLSKDTRDSNQNPLDADQMKKVEKVCYPFNWLDHY
jgi:nuclear pore complex protein Nup54